MPLMSTPLLLLLLLLASASLAAQIELNVKGDAGSISRRIPFQDESLSYRLIQTVRSSFNAVGPLQCESSCSMRAPTPRCSDKLPECADNCKERCDKRAATRRGFRHSACMEACALFCEIEKPTCCQQATHEQKLRP